jgi:hypothetical protein
VPAVREILGQLAAFEALLSGMIDGQIEAYEKWPDGFATYNRRYNTPPSIVASKPILNSSIFCYSARTVRWGLQAIRVWSGSTAAVARAFTYVRSPQSPDIASARRQVA